MYLYLILTLESGARRSSVTPHSSAPGGVDYYIMWAILYISRPAQNGAPNPINPMPNQYTLSIHILLSSIQSVTLSHSIYSDQLVVLELSHHHHSLTWPNVLTQQPSYAVYQFNTFIPIHIVSYLVTLQSGPTVNVHDELIPSELQVPGNTSVRNPPLALYTA